MSITWTTLNRLGRSKVLRSSYVWIVLVPVAARILEKTPDTIELTLFGSQLIFTLLLPFSWKILYLSAVFFSVASLIYSIKCPIVVRDYDNYAQYQEAGRGFAFLMRTLDEVYRSKTLPDDARKNFSFQMSLDFGLHINNDMWGYSEKIDNNSKATYKEISNVPNIVRERLSEFFWHVRDISDLLYGRIVIIVAGLYAAGFILFSIVLIQNFMYVIRQF